MSAGQIWRRDDGLCWVEVQASGVEPSGWRLMIPLTEPGQAPQAPPLVVPIDHRWRARVHLLCGVPDDRLGEPDGRLTADQLADLRAAVRALVDNPHT